VMRQLDALMVSLEALAGSDLLPPVPAPREPSVARRLAASPRTADPVALDAPRVDAFSMMLQVLTDRFHQGGYTPVELPGSEYTGAVGEPAGAAKFSPYDRGDPEAFHGGNIAGLIEKLTYMRGMGADIVWISPVSENRTVISFGGFTGAAYHYYWTI